MAITDEKYNEMIDLLNVKAFARYDGQYMKPLLNPDSEDLGETFTRDLDSGTNTVALGEDGSFTSLTIKGSEMEGATKGEQLINWSALVKSSTTAPFTWNNDTKVFSVTLADGTGSGSSTSFILPNSYTMPRNSEWLNATDKYVVLVAYTDRTWEYPNNHLKGVFRDNTANESTSAFSLDTAGVTATAYTRDGYTYHVAPLMAFANPTSVIADRWYSYIYRADSSGEATATITNPFLTIVPYDSDWGIVSDSLYSTGDWATTSEVGFSAFVSAKCKTIIDDLIDNKGYTLQYEPFTGGLPAPNSSYPLTESVEIRENFFGRNLLTCSQNDGYTTGGNAIAYDSGTHTISWTNSSSNAQSCLCRPLYFEYGHTYTSTQYGGNWYNNAPRVYFTPQKADAKFFQIFSFKDGYYNNSDDTPYYRGSNGLMTMFRLKGVTTGTESTISSEMSTYPYTTPSALYECSNGYKYYCRVLSNKNLSEESNVVYHELWTYASPSGAKISITEPYSTVYPLDIVEGIYSGDWGGSASDWDWYATKAQCKEIIDYLEECGYVTHFDKEPTFGETLALDTSTVTIDDPNEVVDLVKGVKYPYSTGIQNVNFPQIAQLTTGYTWDNDKKELVGRVGAGSYTTMFGKSAFAPLNENWLITSTPKYIALVAFTDREVPYNYHLRSIIRDGDTAITSYQVANGDVYTQNYERDGYTYFIAPLITGDTSVTSDSIADSLYLSFYASGAPTGAGGPRIVNPLYTFIPYDENWNITGDSMTQSDFFTTRTADFSVCKKEVCKRIVDDLIDNKGYHLQYEDFTGGNPTPCEGYTESVTPITTYNPSTTLTYAGDMSADFTTDDPNELAELLVEKQVRLSKKQF